MDKIILAGISQGCATAIHALISQDFKLGGFIGMCSWLPFSDDIKNITSSSSSKSETIRDIWDILQTSEGPEISHDNETDSLSLETSALSLRQSTSTHRALDTPVFLSHSKDDEVVVPI